MTNPKNESARPAAFTLIELLVVIAIIGILAGIVLAGAGYAMTASKKNRAKTELSMIEAALESYKAQRGHYPPDNAGTPLVPPLFYELTGTFLVTSNGGTTAYVRIHGGESLWSTDVTNVGVGGFVNSSPINNINNPAEVQAAEARDFFPTLQPGDYFLYPTNGGFIALLGLPIPGPVEMTAANGRTYTPIRYVSSSPTNNPNSYDLWVDLIFAGKTNRISNWNSDSVIVQ